MKNVADDYAVRAKNAVKKASGCCLKGETVDRERLLETVRKATQLSE